jgi:hypothetical protein
MHGIGDRLIDGVEETCVRIGSEIHDDARGRCDCSDHFNVEHDFGVRPVRAASGLVLPAIHRNGDYGWRRRNLETAEIRVEIRLCEAAAEFDDADSLAFAILPSWEAVCLGHLQGGVGDSRCRWISLR